MVSGDGRDSDDGSSKTAEGAVRTPVPTPAAGVQPAVDKTLTPEEVAFSGAQTAAATKSQQMQAIEPPMEVPTAEMIGKVLTDRYEVVRQIGAGGMGAVYEAKHTMIGKRVAIKVLLDKYAEKDEVIARLEQEARLASSIGHPNIIDITDFGETQDGRRFVVMEYLDGESLGQRLERDGPLPMRRIALICVQIASALGAAHKKGVVHRDLKPDNIFMIERGDDLDFVKVVDFGISKAMRQEDGGTVSPRLTQTGMVLGTPLYMSPEQARGDEDLDERIDVYALGVIMYELATGEVPFRGANYLNIISQVLSKDPLPPREVRPDLEISEAFEAIILKALDKDRDVRYQTMDELSNDLKALAGGGEVGAVSGSFWAMKKRAAKRSPLRLVGWFAAVGGIIAAMALTVTALMSGSDKETPAVAPTTFDAGTRSAAATTDAAPRVPAADVLEIGLTSEPTGATVWADGGQRLICEATPCPWHAVKKDRQVELIFELEGYDDARITVNPLTAPNPTFIRLHRPKKGNKRKKFRTKARVDPGTGSDTTKPGGEDDTAMGELQGNPIKEKRKNNKSGD